MKTKDNWIRFTNWWSVRRVALTLLIVGLIWGIWGYIDLHPGTISLTEFQIDFYANISIELLSISITVLVIDSLYRRGAIKRKKEDLILQMGSHENAFAKEAARRLEVRGWLTDGSLRGAYFHRADLTEAFLVCADLQDSNFRRAKLDGARLYKCNLKGSNVTNFQLSRVASLQDAIMPDGSLYDGRFNLPTDLKWVNRANIDINDQKSMADFYHVAEEVYKAGQEWAENNLESIMTIDEEEYWFDN